VGLWIVNLSLSPKKTQQKIQRAAVYAYATRLQKKNNTMRYFIYNNYLENYRKINFSLLNLFLEHINKKSVG